jgi:cysteine desulfurase family protein
MSRLYLDNAATSFPKPPNVYHAMLRYGTEVGGTAGRGMYFEAREGGRLIKQCRQRINSFINGEDPDHIIFTLNTTDALNLAIKGIVRHRLITEPRRPVHIVATDMEHNSVLRPLNSLADEFDGRDGRGRVEWTHIAADSTGLFQAEAIGAAITPDTALVAVLHVSNVTGTIQPAAEVCSLCRERGIPLLLDAAQSVGHMPVDVQALGADLVALPGHKGLLGPLGTGALYIRTGIEKVLRPQREGGTGSNSESDHQPETMPDKYEAGSQNAVGIVGLSEGVQWLLTRGPEALESHERELKEAMLEGLLELGSDTGRNGLRLLGPLAPEGRVGVFSFVHDTFSPQELAALMEQKYGILGRAGMACAPKVHAMLGTVAQGGAYRLSVGPFNTVDDVRGACQALGELCGVAPHHINHG